MSSYLMLKHWDSQVEKQNVPQDSTWKLTAFDVQPFKKRELSTGLRVCIPHGYYGQISDESSFSTRTGLFVAGVILIWITKAL